jgi:hypothetical protein
MLQVGKGQAFERPENPVLVNGLERHCHVIQFNGLRSREYRSLAMLALSSWLTGI